jgi:enoyl-CoA hydratase
VADQVTTTHADGISTITMDDGKVNVFSIPLLESLHAAFDKAEPRGTVVVLTGRPGYFSAGFDLNVLRGGPGDAVTLLRLGATLAERILAFPAPVLAACSGHAFPAGAFLLMASDVRIGVEGPFKLGLNEVRIGLTLPWFAIALARHRLAPSWFDRATVTGTLFDPHDAREAGLLDMVVASEDLADVSDSVARELAEVDRRAHAATKLRVRQRVLDELHQAIDGELRTGHPASPGA